MFKLTRPTDLDIERSVVTASRREVMNLEHLNESGGVGRDGLRRGFLHDHMRTKIGEGRLAFEAGIQALLVWTQFDLGWVRVANPQAKIEVEQVVAVEVRSLGLWSMNLSQIVAVIRTDSRFGFIYKTTPGHVEEGEERFEVLLDEKSDAVWYETEAVSRPRNLMALLGYPITRGFQHRFARDSHGRMNLAVDCR